jgi:hypothetical protein
MNDSEIQGPLTLSKNQSMQKIQKTTKNTQFDWPERASLEKKNSAHDKERLNKVLCLDAGLSILYNAAMLSLLEIETTLPLNSLAMVLYRSPKHL